MSQLNKKIKTCWGLGEFGMSFMTTIETTFFMFFLTSVAKLPLGTAAIISSITGVCDIIMAVASGAIVDKFNLKWGKNRSWFLITPPFILIFFTIMFTKIGGDVLAAVIITLGYLICHIFFNIAWASARSIVGVLSTDPNDRAFLSARVSIGGALGRLASSKLVPLMVAAFVTVFADQPILCYTVTAFIGALIMGIGLYITFIITKGYDASDVAVKDKKEPVSTVSVKDILVNSLKNKYLIILMFFELTRMTSFFFITSMAVYYCQISLNNAAAVGTFMLVYNLGTLVGTALFSKRMVAKIGSKATTIIATIGSAALTAFAYFFANDLMIVTVLMCISQIFGGMVSGIIVSMFVNCGTYGEYKTGKNTRGFIMGLYSGTIKTGLVVRSWILTGSLALINYQADAVTSATASGINFLFFIVSALILAIGLIPIFFFNLKDSDVLEMEREIQERRTASKA